MRYQRCFHSDDHGTAYWNADRCIRRNDSLSNCLSKRECGLPNGGAITDVPQFWDSGHRDHQPRPASDNYQQRHRATDSFVRTSQRSIRSDEHMRRSGCGRKHVHDSSDFHSDKLRASIRNSDDHGQCSG